MTGEPACADTVALSHTIKDGIVSLLIQLF